METPHEILKGVFGFNDFRTGQKDIIDDLLSGRNVLAVMPTGAGKSLCYQVPALLSDRLTIVVSPLVALMDDQVAGLHACGVNAARIHSGMNRDDQVRSWLDAKSGKCRLLYLSPERLMTDRMLAALSRIDVGMFVVDEAHCISKWGTSFRPEYDQLSRLVDDFPQAVIAAFTATADRATREDVAEKLFRGRGRITVQGFDRPNLRLVVAPKKDWRLQLLTFLEDKNGQSGIVYCLSRKYTEEVTTFLEGKGYSALPYHAGLDAGVRKANQDRFMTENAIIMVATIAFGMGIDKPDIRYVCHLNLPSSMEAYYQEIGRAGRDGEPAETYMLFGLDDLRMRRQFIEEDGEDEEHKLREHKRLDALSAYCEAAHCRRGAMLSYFDEQVGKCGNCDNCLNPPNLIDGTEQARSLLLAIEQTGQFFGAAHIIDILRGADTQKIRDRNHDRLSSYGAGKGGAKDYWQSFIRQAVASGHLNINVQKYGCLEITRKGYAFLQEGKTFLFREIAERSRTVKKASRKNKIGWELSERDAEIFADLKTLRIQLAKEGNVPAYVVFSDATLLDMVDKQPTTPEQLLAVNGVGPGKAKKYGAAFLETLNGAADCE